MTDKNNAGISPIPMQKEDIEQAQKEGKILTTNVQLKLESEKTPSIKEAEPETYSIELIFNNKAELIDVKAPAILSIPMVNNHVVIGALYLAQIMNETREIEKGAT